MTLYYNKAVGELVEALEAASGAGTRSFSKRADREVIPEAEPPIGRAKPCSPRTTVRRRTGRAHYDRETIDAILAEGLVAHVAFVADGQPFAIPMLYAAEGDQVYLHGSPLSRLLGGIVDGTALCLTVTLIDGLVLARSAFHHSINYRSAVVLGEGRAIRDPREKYEALWALVERTIPGRSNDVRGPSDQELDATEVVAVPIAEASAKIRSGPPVDASEDYDLPAWAGEVPLRLVPDRPVPDARCSAPIPTYIAGYGRARA